MVEVSNLIGLRDLSGLNYYLVLNYQFFNSPYALWQFCKLEVSVSELQLTMVRKVRKVSKLESIYFFSLKYQVVGKNRLSILIIYVHYFNSCKVCEINE